jgi:hypothetical protein
MSEEKTRRDGGEGEELPYRLGQHGLRGCIKVHEPEASRLTGEECNVLARVKSVGEGGGLLGTASCSGETVYSPLHGDGVEAMVRGEKALLVHHLGGQTLISGMHTAKEARVKS